MGDKIKRFGLVWIFLFLFILTLNSLVADQDTQRAPVNASFIAVNSKPILSFIPNLTTYVNHGSLSYTLLYIINATDNDIPGDTLFFSSNESWFTISTESTIIGTTMFGKIDFTTSNLGLLGIHNINISVHDLSVNSNSRIIKLNISLINNPPTITFFSPQNTTFTISEGDIVLFNITKVDPDGDTILTQWYFDGFVIPGKTFDLFAYIADYSSAGNHTISVIVKDTFNLTDSKQWNLTILDVPQPLGGDSGGGGGGGGGGIPNCNPNWTCTQWSDCPIYEIQFRTCTDENKCQQPASKPQERQSCTYVPPPTCIDGIKNQHELDIDCGGECTPCPTCSDKMQNQKEEGVDCGGPCPRKCGFIYQPLFYPLCGDNACEGIDLILCPSDCKYSWIYLALIALIIALWIFYGTQKIKALAKSIIARRLQLKSLGKKTTPGISAINKLTLLNQILKAENLQLVSDKFADIIKEFFALFFLIKYEFTYEELESELKKSKVNKELIQKISDISALISQIEYAKKIPTINTLNVAINQAKQIIEELIIFEEIKNNKVRIQASQKSPLKRLIYTISKFPIIVAQKQKQLDAQNKAIRNIKNLTTQINNAVLQKDPNKAQETYQRLKEEYSHLSPKQKLKFYEKLLSLSKSINKTVLSLTNKVITDTDLKNLKAFISRVQRFGFEKQKITSILISKGWTKEQIEYALKN